MATFQSARRYIAWKTEATPGTLLRTTPNFIRAKMGSSTARWVEGQQTEEAITGDFFTAVDSIPNQPHSEITIVVALYPATINSFLANCCLLSGAGVPGPLIAPVSTSIMFGNGLDEDGYAGCQFVGGTIVIPKSGEAIATMRFIGSEPPAQNTALAQSVVTAGLPAYERAYRMYNLQLATFPASATPLTEKRIDSITITIIAQNNPLWYSRGDGVDGISDFALDRLGAMVSLRRVYQTATEKTAYLAACGAPGVADLKLSTTCGTPRTMEFKFPQAIYQDEAIDAPAKDLIGESLVWEALRNTASDTNTGWSPLQFSTT